jgi:hypothetical protein
MRGGRARVDPSQSKTTTTSKHKGGTPPLASKSIMMAAVFALKSNKSKHVIKTKEKRIAGSALASISPCSPLDCPLSLLPAARPTLHNIFYPLTKSHHKFSQILHNILAMTNKTLTSCLGDLDITDPTVFDDCDNTDEEFKVIKKNWRKKVLAEHPVNILLLRYRSVVIYYPPL